MVHFVVFSQSVECNSTAYSLVLACVVPGPRYKTGNAECCNKTDFVKPVSSVPHTGTHGPQPSVQAAKLVTICPLLLSLAWAH